MRSSKVPSLRPDDRADRYRVLYPFAGLVMAGICMGAGVVLFFLRASGQADWEGTFLMVHLRLYTQAPGIVCFLVAALIVYLSRPKRM